MQVSVQHLTRSLHDFDADLSLQAGKDRANGKFDEWKEAEREQYWGMAKTVANEEKEDGRVEDDIVMADDRVIKDSQASSEA